MAGVITGNVQSLSVVSVALSPAEVAINTTAEQTFTVPGVLASDVCVAVSKPTAQAGLGIVGWRVSAANTVGITFANVTGGAITPTASQTYTFVLARPDSTQGGFNV
jgi:hypothetical protein